MTELFCYAGMAELFRRAAGRFGSVVSHPFAKNAKEWGTPRFGLGGKEPSAEILRWESPALPETPLPQDDVNFPLPVLSTGDHAGHKVPPLRFASVGMTEFLRCAAGRFGSVASHLCTERKDGAPFVLVRVMKSSCIASIFLVWVGGRSLRLWRRGRSGPSFGVGRGRGRGAGTRLRGRVPIGFVCRRGRRGWRVCGRLPRTG